MPPFPYRLLDLTHSLSPEAATWDGGCGFEHSTVCDYDPACEYQFRVHKIRMNEGIGTHMDAPAHCVPGGAAIAQIPLADLLAPCCVIDVSASAHERSRVSPADIRNFEKAHGRIAPGSLVLMKTGWERFWPRPESYRNNGLFPSVSAAAAELLLERGIAGLGLDTLSPDREEDGFPVHKLVLDAGKFILENVANLDRLSPSGDFVLAAPMKIKNGTEAPVRLIGFAQ